MASASHVPDTANRGMLIHKPQGKHSPMSRCATGLIHFTTTVAVHVTSVKR